MYQKEVTITNPTGLHARPATQLVKLAEKYDSDLEIINGTFVANPKSIFNVLAAGIGPGVTITVKAQGQDERKAVDELCDFIGSLEE